MFKKIFNGALIAVPLVLASCTNGGANGNGNGGGGGISKPTGIEISTPAVVPVFSNTSTTTGLWVHNYDSSKVKDIYVTASPGSEDRNSSAKTLMRSIIKKLPMQVLETFGYTSPFLSTSSGFALDEPSIGKCTIELNKGANHSCFIQFRTPVVREPSDNDYVMIHVVTTDNVEKSQIINWEATGSVEKVPGDAFMTRVLGKVQYGYHATFYTYAGAATNFVKAKLNLQINPLGISYISNGYTDATEIAPGGIVPVEVVIMPTSQPSSSAKGIDNGPVLDTNIYASLTYSGPIDSGFTTEMSNLTIAPGFADRANLVTSIIPPLFESATSTLLKAYTIAVYNNSNESAVLSPAPFLNATPVGIASIATTCGAQIAASTSCNITITALKAGSTALNISYTSLTGGESVLDIAPIPIQVFNNNGRGAYISISASTGDIQLAESKALGGFESIVVTYTMFNSAVSPESAIAFLIAPGIKDIVGAAAVIESQTTTCTATIIPGGNCTATLKIKSANSTAIGTGVYYESYSYTTAQESILLSPRASSISAARYTVYGDPFLDPLPPTLNMVIAGNNAESIFESVRFINTGTESAKIESPISFTLTGTITPNSLKVESALTTCNTGRSLNIGESCLVYFKLGAKAVFAKESGTAVFSLKYNNAVFGTTRGIFSSNVTINWTINKESSGMILTNIESVPTKTEGNGTSSAMVFYGGGESTPGTGQKLRLTYKNPSKTFTLSQQFFNLSTLPSIWKVDQTSTTCGYVSGTTTFTGTLNPESSCVLMLMINRDDPLEITSLTSTAGIASLNFTFPTSSWRESVGVQGISYESNFIFNSVVGFTGSYQAAVIQGSYSTNGGTPWESAIFTQTLMSYEVQPTVALDGTKYNTTIESSQFGFDMDAFNITLISGPCTVLTVGGPESTPRVTCSFTNSAPTGNWRVQTKILPGINLPGGQVGPIYNQVSAPGGNPVELNPNVVFFSRPN